MTDPKAADIEEIMDDENGATPTPSTQETSAVSRPATRGAVERERKSTLELGVRLNEEFEAITKVYKDCQERVKKISSLKTGTDLTEVNDCFKKARTEAQKGWDEMRAVIERNKEGKDFVTRERRFLDSVGGASLEEVEMTIRLNREKGEEYREILESVKDIEGVDDIPGLLRKIDGERIEFARERASWESVREELNEINGSAQLKGDERLIDRWNSLTTELQSLREELAALSVDGDTEKAELKRKNAELQSLLDQQTTEFIRVDDERRGEAEARMKVQKEELEKMRKQREELQRIREMRRSGEVSTAPSRSTEEVRRTEDLHTFEAPPTGTPSSTVNAGRKELGAGDSEQMRNEESIGNGPVVEVTRATSGNDGTLSGIEMRSEKEEKVWGQSTGLLANKLPRLSKYAGRKEDWEDFETGFMIRYGGMERTVAMSLLKDNLEGKARETLRGVPDDEKEKGIKSVLEWLRKKLSDETPFQEIEWEKKLRTQTVNGRTVGVVCEELEKYTKKLYSDEEKKEKERRKQLLILYEGRQVEQMRLLSLWSEAASYEKMKNALIELEYLRKTERDVRGGSRSGGTVTCNRCGGFGHREAQCTSKTGQGGSNSYGGGYSRGYSGQGTGGGYRSTTQGGRGGFSQNQSGYRGGQGWQGGQQTSNGGGYKWQGANNQYSGQRPQTSAAGGATTTPKTYGGGLGTGANRIAIGSGRGAHGCSVVRSERAPISAKVLKEENQPINEIDEYFFIKKRERVKGLINGVLVEVLLDTGADVSVISRNVVDRMKGAMVEKGRTVEVTDAQGRKMDIMGRIILEVDLEVGRKTPVGFYVVNNSLSTVIIGGKGLECIGVELKEVEYNENEDETEGKGDVTGGEAIVIRDCEIHPGSLGRVWVTGNENAIVMLESPCEQVVQGVACRERIVSIPVYNDTDGVIQFEKHQSLGKWKVMDGGEVNEVATGTSAMKGEQPNWSAIREKLVVNRGEEMNPALERVLSECAEAFAKSEEDIGRLTDWDCAVDVMEGKPVRQKPRPIPFAIREKLRALVDRMMRQGVVKKSQSPWSSPIVVVKKKDGSLRLCIDYRKVNQMIRLDAQPLPHLESTIQSLSGKKFFSTIDLQSGFWQVGLAEGAREVTAFSLLGEHFEFQVLPFGLNVSPCQFQRAMMEMLKEEMEKEGTDQKVFCYIDDVLIATETEEEHRRLIDWVLRRMIERGVKVNPHKCKFMMKQVEYLGHYVSDKGVSMEERKVAAVREHPRPKNASEVRSFVGLVSYYRRFVKGFAKIAGPLHALTANGVVWRWGSEEEKAFNELKRAITEAPVLIQPDCEAAIKGSRPFLITTDASGHGIGGVLSQANEEGVEQPIAFYSRSLRGPESNYSIIDLEALAIFEAVRKWKYIIFGTRVIVRTDHAPLLSMFKRQNVCPRILRWATEMREYNLEIVHVKGKDNVVADDLSRFPIPPRDGEAQEPVTIGEDIVINAISRRQLNAEKEMENNERAEREIHEGLARWKEIQQNDEWVQEMIRKKKENIGKEGKEMVMVPDSSRKYSIADLLVEQGLLFILDRDHERRLYVPSSERERLVKEVHESVLVGHAGGKKMTQMLKKEYIWGSMDKDISKVLRGCHVCLKSKPRRKFIPELQPREAKAPLEIVAVDLLDMGRGSQGNRYILTVIDLFTRYAGAYPIKDKKADTVAREFMKRWVLDGGRVPKSLLSDNGGEFINEVMEEISKLWEIDRKCTLPYHSRANGGVERLNRTITEILRRLVGRTDEWEEALPYAVYCYNTAPHRATGESPSFLFYGRDERLPVGESWKANENYVVDLDDYKSQMMLLMKKTKDEVNERLEGERERMRTEYNKKSENNKLYEPMVGDRVYAFKERGDEKNPKLRIAWEGPYRVIERSKTTAKIVRMEDGKEKVVQLDKLRKVPRVENNAQVRLISDKSNCSHVVDVKSPLHWDSVCQECKKAPREMSEIWSGCPKAYAGFTFETLREYAVLRSLLEKWGTDRFPPSRAHRLMAKRPLDDSEVTEKIAKETIEFTCAHSLRIISGPTQEWRFTIEDVPERLEMAYRQGLGEDVEKSMGYGVVLLERGTRLPTVGGDSARWDWREKELSNWPETLLELEADEERSISKLLIYWPRGMDNSDMETLRETVTRITTEKGWETVVAKSPSGCDTSPSYHQFLLDWESERIDMAHIRVFGVDDGGTTDGTAISAMQRVYPWMTRTHWEYAMEAWCRGTRWNPKRAERELLQKKIREEEKATEESTQPSAAVEYTPTPLVQSAQRTFPAKNTQRGGGNGGFRGGGWRGVPQRGRGGWRGGPQRGRGGYVRGGGWNAGSESGRGRPHREEEDEGVPAKKRRH